LSELADKPPEKSIDELKADLELIGQRLEKARNFIQKAATIVSDKDKEFLELQEILEETLRKLQEKFDADVAPINEARKQAHEAKLAAMDKESELEQEAKRLRELIRMQEELAKAQAASQLLEDRWKTMLIGAPWREWARDHQLDAAKQFAVQKRMILADAMGLGKTLSAIMSLEFIKAAT
jgi:SNF2 family DNA or RNA helicase